MLAMLQSVPSLQSSSESDETQEEEQICQPPLVQQAANIFSANNCMQLEILHLLKELATGLKYSRETTKKEYNRQGS